MIRCCCRHIFVQYASSKQNSPTIGPRPWLFKEAEVRSVVEKFRGLFRKSPTPDGTGEHFYTVHLRYARRPPRKPGEAQDASNEPLTSQEISSLLELISIMVTHEKETSRLLFVQEEQFKQLSLEIKQQNWAQTVTSITSFATAIIAAVVAISVAVMTLKQGDGRKRRGIGNLHEEVMFD